MAISREDINRRFASDLEAAEAWREADPARFSQEREKAYDRRSESQDALTQAAEAAGRTATLGSAKTAALAKYPLAAGLAHLITGDNAEAIEAAAKSIHAAVAGQQEAAVKAANVGRRPQTRTAWTGSPTGVRPGLPGGELAQPESQQTEQVSRTYGRMAEVIREAAKPGVLRQYSEDATALLRAPDVEAQALADHELLVPNTGISRRAMQAKSQGAEFTTPPGSDNSEDRRG